MIGNSQPVGLRSRSDGFRIAVQQLKASALRRAIPDDQVWGAVLVKVARDHCQRPPGRVRCLQVQWLTMGCIQRRRRLCP